MRKFSIRKDEKAVSPVIAVILMVAITVVLSGVLYVWVYGIIDTDDEAPPSATLKLSTRDELNSSMGQNLVILSHVSGDNIKWSEMKIQISNDGGTFFIIKFDTEEPNLNVIMTKGPNIGDVNLFEAGECIYFKEGGTNWPELNDFYIRIVHKSATIYDQSIDLV